MSTADVARDLDLLRQAVGDDGLTYDGVSYGSFLGNVYANLFPDKVRAVVIDGVLDPVAWTTGRPPSGALAPVLDAARIGARRRRHPRPVPEDVRCRRTGSRARSRRDAAAKFDRLDARAKQAPVPNGFGGELLTYDLFNTILLGELYDSAGWEFLAEGLRETLRRHVLAVGRRAGRGRAGHRAGSPTTTASTPSSASPAPTR